jgi:hypothetical protein
MNPELLETAIWTVVVDRGHIELDPETTSQDELQSLSRAVALVYEELAEDFEPSVRPPSN